MPAGAGPRCAGGGGATAPPRWPRIEALARYATFGQVLDLITANRDMTLKIEVEKYLRLARYSPGRIEFTPADGAPRDLAARLAQRLQGWTGVRWGVSVVPGCTAPTIAETPRRRARCADAPRRGDNPLVQAVLAAFPAARIEVRSRPRPRPPNRRACPRSTTNGIRSRKTDPAAPAGLEAAYPPCRAGRHYLTRER